MKILIRKLRVNNIIFKTNLGSILNKVTKERDFFLNKLKDIEYLYFNPIISNSNEEKNILLKSILKSQFDSTILIDSKGKASIKDLNDNKFLLNNFNNETNEIINPKSNSQNIMRIKLAYSKNNNKIKDNQIFNDKEYNLYNKSQPILSENNKKFESNIFPVKNDFIGMNNINNNNERDNINSNIMNNKHITPSTKTAYYDISSHILNESLHIPNTENANPNLINNIDLD